jgi:hypothetical protein
MGVSAGMIANTIQRFFLRRYALELRPERWRPFNQKAFDAAIFQTVVFVSLPVYGLAASTIVFLPDAMIEIVTQRYSIVALIILLGLTAVTYKYVRRVVDASGGAQADVSAYASSRDHLIATVQLWTLFTISVAIPFLVGVFAGSLSLRSLR